MIVYLYYFCLFLLYAWLNITQLKWKPISIFFSFSTFSKQWYHDTPMHYPPSVPFASPIYLMVCHLWKDFNFDKVSRLPKYIPVLKGIALWVGAPPVIIPSSCSPEDAVWHSAWQNLSLNAEPSPNATLIRAMHTDLSFCWQVSSLNMWSEWGRRRAEEREGNEKWKGMSWADGDGGGLRMHVRRYMLWLWDGRCLGIIPGTKGQSRDLMGYLGPPGSQLMDRPCCLC